MKRLGSASIAIRREALVPQRRILTYGLSFYKRANWFGVTRIFDIAQ